MGGCYEKEFFFLITIGAFLSLSLTPIIAFAQQPDFTLEFDFSQETYEVMNEVESSGLLNSVMTVPLTYSDVQVGYLKVEFTRMKAKNMNGNSGLQYFGTAHDTFYLKEIGLTMFGRRKDLDGKSFEYTGNGVVQELIDNSQNEIIDLKMLYFFDIEEEEINFYFQ